MNLVIKDIITLLNASFSGSHSENSIENVSLDSRSLQNNQQTLFFCLVGPNNNGHHYIAELIEKGVRNFIVSEKVEPIQDVNFLAR